MKHAIISIEDRRFYTNSGVDLRGIARAAVEDVTSGGAVQGASTIPQQFVKISLAAENERTVFQKLREAALAYHLTRKWSKERILRNYLNSIYFGNGAYGIESAARTYFAYNHDGCGSQKGQPRVRLGAAAARGRAARRRWSPRRARTTRPSIPSRAKRRRDLVLLRMSEQGYLTRAHLRRARRPSRCPTRDDLTLPEGGHGVPVLHLLDQAAGRRPARRRPAGRAAGVRGRAAASRRRSTRACRPPRRRRSTRGCRASSRPARLAGRDLQQGRRGAGDGRRRQLRRRSPFNLATQGQRQPGSSFKPFVLAEALRAGHQPELHVGVARS